MTYEEAVKGLHNTYVKKNAAYGDSAHRSYMKYGRVSYLVRIGDKLNRMEQLTANDDLDTFGESLMDTIGDCATYLVMLVNDILNEECHRDTDVEMIFVMLLDMEPGDFVNGYASVHVHIGDNAMKDYSEYMDWVESVSTDDPGLASERYLDLALCMIAKYCMIANAMERNGK